VQAKILGSGCIYGMLKAGLVPVLSSLILRSCKFIHLFQLPQ